HEKNPVASAAALATLDVIEEERLVERARELGTRGLARLREMKSRHSRIEDVRGLGAYFGVEIGGRDPAGFADRLLYRCLAKGLSFKLGGGRIVTLCPPLTIPLDEFDAALAILDGALGKLGG